jgi:predicted nucleotidyltransferase
MLDVDAITQWLSAAAGGPASRTVEMHLFGSVLETDGKPSDVDIVIVFAEWDVRSLCTEMKERFQRSFCCPLHIQMFHVSQTEQLTQFLKDAQRTRRIM